MILPPKNISKEAQLIQGIGASSWFTIYQEAPFYRIERFSIEGNLECSKLFNVFPEGFDISCSYKFVYLSHCKECTVLQNQKTFKFYSNED